MAVPSASAPATQAAQGTPVPQSNQPLAMPPAAKLQIGDQAQTGELGTYCWQPPALKGRTFEATCADALGVPTALDPLVVHAPFTATFTLSGDKAPSEVSLYSTRVTAADEMSGMPQGKRWWRAPSGQPTGLEATASPSTRLTLSPGEYLLTLFVRWTPPGDATYGFLVKVQ